MILKYYWMYLVYAYIHIIYFLTLFSLITLTFLVSPPLRQWFQIDIPNLSHTSQVFDPFDCHHNFPDWNGKQESMMIFCVYYYYNIWRNAWFSQQESLHPIEKSQKIKWCWTLKQGQACQLFLNFQKVKVQRKLNPYLLHQFEQFLLLWVVSTKQKELHWEYLLWNQIYEFGNSNLKIISILV